MCGFDIRCAAEQETEVNGMGNHLLIIWDIGPERASPVSYRTTVLQRFKILWTMVFAIEDLNTVNVATMILRCCNFATVTSV